MEDDIKKELDDTLEDSLEPEQFRKLFIGGLDYRTTDDGLKEYFEKYGEIVDVVVMKDPKTKRSRGFGFVAFSNSDMVDLAQKDRPHRIDGRVVDTKRAVPRDEIGRPERGATVKKIFVGGLKEETGEEDLREVFEEFGAISQVVFPVEKESQKKRGFAFIEFEDYDSVDKACLQKNISILNKRVEIKKALSRAEMMHQRSGPSSGRGSSGGGMGGGGGGGGSGSAPHPWANRNDDSWGNNQPVPWENRGWGNQGNYNAGPSPMSSGGYGNQGSWQGGSPNAGWNQGGPASGCWDNPPGSFGGPSNSWNSPSGSNDFGNNYGQNFGGGPMRNQGYGNLNRSTPYNTGGVGRGNFEGMSGGSSGGGGRF